MKDAIIIPDKKNNLMHFVYENHRKTISMTDPKCAQCIQFLSKNYTIKMAEITTKTINDFMKEITVEKAKIQKSKIEQQQQIKNISDKEKSTLYRSTCKGPLIIADIQYTLNPGQYINMKNLDARQAKSHDLQICISNGLLIKTTIQEINKMYKEKEKIKEKDEIPILNTSVKNFVDGSPEGPEHDAEPIDITADVSRASDTDVNDPRKSMTALLNFIEEGGEDGTPSEE